MDTLYVLTVEAIYDGMNERFFTFYDSEEYGSMALDTAIREAKEQAKWETTIKVTVARAGTCEVEFTQEGDFA